MGVTFDYSTIEPVSKDVRECILKELEQTVKRHDWWCEPMWFSKPKGENDKLVGWNKLFLVSGYTSSDGSFIELDDADDADEQMARRDAVFILRQLCTWSQKYGVSWSLEIADVDLGTIVAGEISERTVSEFMKQCGWDIKEPIDEARASELSKKYGRRH